MRFQCENEILTVESPHEFFVNVVVMLICIFFNHKVAKLFGLFKQLNQKIFP